jgi:GntR family transcriptional regulator
MLIHIDRHSTRPAYLQVADELSRLILCGALGPDEQIPSVRSLALDLAINPNTIQKAYARLETAGISYAVAGVGRFISPDARALIIRHHQENLGLVHRQLSELAQAGISKQKILAVVEEAWAHVPPATSAVPDPLPSSLGQKGAST